MTLYPKEVIEKTNAWMEGDSHAKQWLSQNNFEELIELKVASLNNTKAIEYLLVHKHFILAAFVNAIWEDKKAHRLLMDKKEFHWAAMASFINGDVKAAGFLEKNNLKHYAELAQKIQANIRKDIDKRSNFFNSGPYKV
jgi:phosphoribosylformimino-5-aminoimidazole carboxamide ribonucleotide (ProFAR) isomerase